MDTWTYDENHDDVRRMVISRGMVNKTASMYRDALGMQYAQLPPYYGLCYAITYMNICNLCKMIEEDEELEDGDQWLFDDECYTIYKWLERLEEATGISHDHGLHECELKDGQLFLIMVISCSDKLETVPRPAKRIQRFKDFLRVTKEPVVRRFNQPRMYS
ncbi:hypothetical protein EV715DRAFT_288380 [Schizophyllum commune]